MFPIPNVFHIKLNLRKVNIKLNAGVPLVVSIFSSQDMVKVLIVSGILTLSTSKSFFLYIGGKGTDNNPQYINAYNTGGYNGGGNGNESGGGVGTDVRLKKKDKYSSRIIVAGGGAGGERAANGHEGALSGVAGEYHNCGGTLYHKLHQMVT